MKKKRGGKKKDVRYKLDILREIFSLTNFDIDVILVCIAREIDLRYEKLFSYLQDDITKKHPSIDLLLNLFSTSLLDKIDKRNKFSDEMPLRKYNLVEVFDDGSQQNTVYLNKCLKLDERIVDYLFDYNQIDSRIRTYIEFSYPHRKLEEILLSIEVKNQLQALSDINIESLGYMFYFQGPDGVGKKSTIEALCTNSDLGLITVDIKNIIDNKDFAEIIKFIVREAKIQNVSLYLKNIDELLDQTKQLFFKKLMAQLEGFSNHIYASGISDWQAPDEILCKRFFKVEFKRQNYSERIRLWERMLGCKSFIQDLDIEEISGRFRLTGGQIRRAVEMAYNLAYWRKPEAICVTRDDIYMACREQSNHKLGKLTQKIVPHYGWDDICITSKKNGSILRIFITPQNIVILYTRNGALIKKLSLGKGLNVLFTGPSGTGKTMAAEIMACELGLDFYKIDLSSVVSKYIGETEKNLSLIFSEAETANAILFFDEADALFGKRSAVSDAHDRYANIETGYLLQKMEEYTGVVFLATNLDKNMDEAFSRRMHFVVEFPFPNIRERQLIWEKVWPEKNPA